LVNEMHKSPYGTPKLPTDTGVGDVAKLLRRAGLRPTRQRVALAHLLFTEGDRHVTAEALHEEAQARKVPVSLATVYNTLHQFTEVGLLRAVAVEGAKTYFDTNTSNHYHFFCEHSGQLMDISTGAVRIEGLPEAPEGMAISRVDVLVRLVDKSRD
jgi:Fur family iron response transcriptional regulator